MSLGKHQKTEHSGAKNGGGHWGDRAEAKRISKKRRRENEKAEIRKEATQIKKVASKSGSQYPDPHTIELQGLVTTLRNNDELVCGYRRFNMTIRELRKRDRDHSAVLIGTKKSLDYHFSRWIWSAKKAK